jgi:tRNA:m4X modification enzyme
MRFDSGLDGAADHDSSTVGATVSAPIQAENPLTLLASKPETGSGGSSLPQPPVGWTKCRAFLPSKNRFCRQQPAPQFIPYCGNHQHLLQNEDTPTETSNGGNPVLELPRRIPCPLDSSHYIKASDVERHVLVCPFARAQKGRRDQYYFQHNINLGGHGALCCEGCLESKNATPNLAAPPGVLPLKGVNVQVTETKLQWAQRVTGAILRAYQQVFMLNDDNGSDTRKLVEPHLLSYHDMYAAIQNLDLSGPELSAGPGDDLGRDGECAHSLQSAVEFYRIKSGGYHHLYQQASLIGILRHIKSLPPALRDSKRSTEGSCGDGDLPVTPTAASESSRHFVVEMGAGRGMLGTAAAGVSATGESPSHLILIERSGSRAKADTVLRQCQKRKRARSSVSEESTIPPAIDAPPSSCSYMDLSRVTWTRIPCDLSHVSMTAVLDVESKTGNDVEIGTPNNAPSRVTVIAKHLCGCGTDIALKSLEPVRNRIDACLMATCCHGVCNYNDYVGRDYLSRTLVRPALACSPHASDNGERIDSTEIMQDWLLSEFGSSEFELLRRWSAGAVLDRNPSGSGADSAHCAIEEREDKFDSIGIKAIVDSMNLSCGVQGLGRACARLIDFGRREYLREVIFGAGATEAAPTEEPRVGIVHYAPPTITPQNAALLAFRAK